MTSQPPSELQIEAQVQPEPRSEQLRSVSQSAPYPAPPEPQSEPQPAPSDLPSQTSAPTQVEESVSQASLHSHAEPQSLSQGEPGSNSHPHTRSAQAQRTAITAELGVAAVPEEAWRHFHKITPITRMGIIWVALVYFVFNLFGQALQDEHLLDMLRVASAAVSLKILGIALAALIGVSLLVIVPGYVGWKRRTFALAESGIHFRQGVLMKNHTQMRWDRVQSVEIQQTLFGRIFGFGTVKVESAGNDVDLELGLLRVRDAAALRREILVSLDRVRSGLPPLAAGGDTDTPAHLAFQGAAAMADQGIAAVSAQPSEAPVATQPSEPPAVAQPSEASVAAQSNGVVAATSALSEHAVAHIPAPVSQPLSEPAPLVLDADDLERDVLVYELTGGRLIASRMLSVSFIVAMLITVVGVMMAIVFMMPYGIAIASGWLGILVMFVGYAWSFIKGLFDDFGTKLYLSENGLRRRAGLTKLVTSTYPPQRIHAVRVYRPWLWKRLDWWRVDILRAGVAGDTETLTRTFVPVATREQMLRIMWTLMPGLGTHEDSAVLAEAFDGRGSGQWFAGAPTSAKWLDPIGRVGRGLALTPRAVLTRSGRLGRMVSIIFQDHIQSMRISVGPLQQKLTLASLRMDLVLGVHIGSAINLEADQLWQMMQEENERAREARRAGVAESLTQWKERVGIAGV
ncbi:MAG: PH domain-containing protein [Arcanobacterium sp.]|nr:PH domain-containing protein [Arcanobacterium sp.]